MQPMYYIGLDVHKQKISYCVKDSGGKLFAEGWIPATRHDLDCWMKKLTAAVERGDGSYHVHRLDLRSLKTTRHRVKSSPSMDATGHYRREKEERPY